MSDQERGKQSFVVVVFFNLRVEDLQTYCIWIVTDLLKKATYKQIWRPTDCLKSRPKLNFV